MKSVATLIVAVTTSLALLLGGMDAAEAKRLGGGQSFGSKFSHSQPVNRSATTTPTQKGTLSPAQQTNSERKQQLSNRGGLMGLLGGLAIGGLLGALLFGGAFEGFNFMDLLLFAALGFAAFAIFRAMAGRNQPRPATPGPNNYHAQSDYDLQGHESSSHLNSGTANAEQTLDSLRGDTPKGFDQSAFVDGAKNCFARLQRAWDEGDLADIRQFTTDHVFGEIQDQFSNRIGNTKTEIVELHAELLSANDLGSKQEAIVLFKAQLREEGNPIHVDEVWHFIKASNNASWQLDGIQQVAG